MKKQKTRSQIKKNNSALKSTNKAIKIEDYITTFDKHLKIQKGLVTSSRENACRVGRLFLDFTSKSRDLHLSKIKSIDIINFINEYAKNKSLHYIQNEASRLRSFLRFLKFKGWVAVDFSHVVPTVAVWGKDRIPDCLTEQEVKKLLKSCDKSTPIGLRDYTILRLLLGLGLRSFEASNLTLENFDWDSGIVTVRGKGSRISQLPLPQDLGDDLAIYLLKGRPRTSSRSFFVSVYSPFQGLYSPSIGRIVETALKRVGLKKKGRRAHLLRHTFAQLLLNKGASLQEVGDILRHQSINTTTIYAKVDFKKLRSLALSWPGNLNFGGAL